MKENEYYEISNEKGLPLRCPILNYCSRRAWTIYLFSEYSKYDPGLNFIQALQKDGTISNDFEENQIQLQGEPPSILRGNGYYDFLDVCPEVNLFESSHALISGKACVSGNYDKERNGEKVKVAKSQHFSQCAEFNKYLFDNNLISKKRKAKKRKTVSPKERAYLQKEINSECPFCKNEDVGHFQVHHIDENSENNLRNNLIMLCPNCHSKITKGDILMDEVKKLKEKLIQ